MVCNVCSSTDFSPQKRCRPCWATYMRGWASNNREKVSLQNKQYKHRHPDKYKDSQLRNAFGISLQEYNQLLETLGGVCKICCTPPKQKRLAVDHCHKTGKIRGLLCGTCNRGLGYFKDSPELLQTAAQYLSER